MASVRQRTNRDLGRENGLGKVVYYVASHPWKSKRTSTPTVTREGQTTERVDKKNLNWQQRLSLLLINLLWDSHGVLALVGFVVEWTLNFLALNGSLWTLPFRCIFHFSKQLIVPFTPFQGFSFHSFQVFSLHFLSAASSIGVST
jgi:hypothetical protein